MASPGSESPGGKSQPRSSGHTWMQAPDMLAAHGFVPQDGALPVAEKNVDGQGGTRFGKVIENNPEGASDQSGPEVQKQDGPQKKKKAGVESFTVTWTNRSSDTTAGLRLDYTAKFKKDDDHDPALAEFRQNVKTVATITDGPNKGYSVDTSPMHDDNYSRADDVAGNSPSDVDFVSNDNPGISPIDPDDVIDYSFTAEQMIIDTSDGNKVIAKRGPHTGTVKGKHPRVADGVPQTLS